MLRIALLLTLLFPALSFGQNTVPLGGAANTINVVRGGILIDSTIQFTPRDTARVYFGRKSDLVRQSSNNKLYAYSGGQYVEVGGKPGSAVFTLPTFTTFADSTAYPFASLQDKELVSVIIEGSIVTSRCSIAGNVLNIPSGLGAGQRVDVLYRSYLSGVDSTIKASGVTLDQPRIFVGKRIYTSGGSAGQLYDDPGFCSSDIIPISPAQTLTITKGTGAGSTLHCFDTGMVWLGTITGLSATTVTPTPLSGTVAIRMVVSSSTLTRDADIKAFTVRQSDIFTTYQEPAARQVVSVTGSTVMADAVKGQANFVTINSFTWSKTPNLHSIDQTRDSQYVYNDGRRSVGAGSPASNYSMGKVSIDSTQSYLSVRRRTGGPGTFGCFYDKNDRPIMPAITGKSGMDTFTVAIPSGARWLRYNASSSPTYRQFDKDVLTIVYGSTVPQYTQPGRRLLAINGARLPGTCNADLYFAIIGMSIDNRAYLPGSATDPTISHMKLAIMRMGGYILDDRTIPSSVYAVNADSGTSWRTPMVLRVDSLAAGADITWSGSATNDFLYGGSPFGSEGDTSVYTFWGALDTYCKKITQNNPKARHYMETIMFRYATTPGNRQIRKDTDTNDRGYSIRDYNAAIKRTCEKWGITVIDNNQCGVNPFVASQQTMWTDDGTHLNPAGCSRVADFNIRKLCSN